MLVLVAPASDDPRDGGFNYCVSGELLIRGPICHSGQDGSCGCERSWTGITSQKGSTLALVTESAMQREQYTNLIAEHLTGRGWPRRTARAEAALLLDVADGHHAGTYVTIGPSPDRDGHVFGALEPEN